MLTYQHPSSRSIYEKRTKIRTWVHLQGISFENTIHTSELFKRIKAFFYTVENKARSCFSAPFPVLGTPRDDPREDGGGGARSSLALWQMLVGHCWYFKFASGRIALVN